MLPDELLRRWSSSLQTSIERCAPTERRFLTVPDALHTSPEIENVVERHDRYWIVEKRGDAGREAEELAAPSSGLSSRARPSTSRGTLSARVRLKPAAPALGAGAGVPTEGTRAAVRTAIVSTYPPRACGIGTFAADVRGALLGLDGIDRVEKVVIVNEPSRPQRPGPRGNDRAGGPR